MSPSDVDRMFELAIVKVEGLLERKTKAATPAKAAAAPNVEREERRSLPQKARAGTAPMHLGSYASYNNQLLLLTLARLVRSEQSQYSKYTTMPPTFVVPARDPWPAHVRGKTVNVNGFRAAKTKDKIHPKIEKKLNAINFVWDLKQHKWEMNLWGLRIYKVCHGDLDIPESFIVQNKDETYPRELWSFALGQWLAKTKAGIQDLPEVKKQALTEVGVQWVE
ncbi:hypothetical protein DYB32_000829 [Aphanomyces invadans]|uniref:Uncharacterized protein n=1 Tax=Aphanomyces invadans TaxID=157072 RepID=A0A3R6YFZ5_9STRA|nr:hypothetical protein DYB32_000829 [Aphanomyces invadans]